MVHGKKGPNEKLSKKGTVDYFYISVTSVNDPLTCVCV